MAGESTKNSDFRKAVKVKPPKKKDPLKSKIPAEASANKKGKKGKKKGRTWKFTPASAKENMDNQKPTDQKGNCLKRQSCYSLRQGVSKDSGYLTMSAIEKYGLASTPAEHLKGSPDDKLRKLAST